MFSFKAISCGIILLCNTMPLLSMDQEQSSQSDVDQSLRNPFRPARLQRYNAIRERSNYHPDQEQESQISAQQDNQQNIEQKSQE